MNARPGEHPRARSNRGDDVAGVDVPECTSCGVCCFSHAKDYLPVLGVDYERLGDEATRWVEFDGHRAFMRMQDGHCAALRYDEKQARFLCTIYERRPDVCRWLERGSGYCAADRAEKAERPLVMLRKK
ncbi:MAG TPA: YkgJ family cysteine cluster protein [Polyangiaceae bacterium]|nr:YkgJ family cysteine cluster protein [Polyangiaceae bacterium]